MILMQLLYVWLDGNGMGWDGMEWVESTDGKEIGVCVLLLLFLQRIG
jgi:hypothetical protein